MKKLIQIMLAIVTIVVTATFACSCSPSSITSAIMDNTSKLQTPDGIYLDEDNVLRWNSVPNASSYIVTIEEKDYERSTVACDLKKILKSNGSYEVFVKAKSNTVNIFDSDYSEGVTVKFTGAKDDDQNQKTETKLFGEFEDLFTKEAYIGYGYDVIGSSYVNSREVKVNYPIFDRDKLLNQRLIKFNERDSQDEYISGNSMESYQAEFESKLKTKLKISKAFSASLNAKYKTTTSSTASALFYEYRHSTVCYSLVLQCDFEEYKNMLTSSFKRDLMSLDLPTLFSHYGTHLITSAIMGGRFDLNYTMLSNENIDTSKLSADLDTTLKAWCVDTSVSASVDIEEKAKQNKCDISTYSKVYGGDYIAMQNEKAILSNYQKWLSTIEDKPALIGIRDINSLVPIWELLGDSAEEQARRAEMQNYFEKYGQETYDALLENYEITPPIYPTGLNVALRDEKKNLLENNTTYAGAKIYLDLSVEPENAPISKSVTFNNSDYVIYNSADDSVLIKDDVPNNTTLYITVNIGNGIEQTVAVKIMQTCKVSFRANGGVTASGNPLSTIVVKHGDAINAPEQITKEDCLFDGWYTDENYTNEFIFGETPITADTVLYAKWKRKVKVTFNSMGGTEIPSVSVYEDELIDSKIENPNKLGAEFVGWFTSPDCTADSRFYIETTKVKTDITLYAGWASGVYIVKFDSKGGQTVADIRIEHGKSIGTLPLVERIGYLFIGWFADENYNSEVTAKTPVIDNITLYAKWKADTFAISFNFSGGSGEGEYPNSYTIESNNITVKNPTRYGYEFAGWVGTTGFEDPIMTIMILKGSMGNKSYTATWTGIKCSIEYNFNETSNSEEQDSGMSYSKVIWQDQSKDDFITYGTIGTCLNIPQASYYKFDGWYTSKTEGVQITDRNGMVVNATQFTTATTLYAHWSKDESGKTYIYVKTAADFKNIMQNMNGHYVLIEDIDLGDHLEPFGACYWKHVVSDKADDNASMTPFKGQLDGRNHTISYTMKFNSFEETMTSDYSIGLFATSDGAIFKNIKLKANLIATGKCAKGFCAIEVSIGGLVGTARNTIFDNIVILDSSYIENNETDRFYTNFWGSWCYVGALYTGGVVGDARQCSFNNCYNYAKVFTQGFTAYAGGIAGNAYECTGMNSCLNYGDVTSLVTPGYNSGERSDNNVAFGKTTAPWLRKDGKTQLNW